MCHLQLSMHSKKFEYMPHLWPISDAKGCRKDAVHSLSIPLPFLSYPITALTQQLQSDENFYMFGQVAQIIEGGIDKVLKCATLSSYQHLH